MENMSGQLAGTAVLALRGEMGMHVKFGEIEIRHQSPVRYPLSQPEASKPPVASPLFGFAVGIPLRAEGGK